MSHGKKLSQIKSSLVSRSLSLAKIGLNAGIKYAGTKITNSSMDHFINNQALVISKEFGELKGSLMKAGQMLSVYGEYFLPAEANNFLKSLQSSSPSVEWTTMKKHLEMFLDKSLIDELDINPDSIGSASMGQVHLATIKTTGEKIALKIQYPNLENAINSDISALKKILSIAKILPKGLNLDPVFEEIKSMLVEELDYELEAKKTIEYQKLLLNDSRYVVPKVYSRYSNKQVLATEYIEGLRADHILIQALSQERRNKISENFLELYFKEIFEWNFVQTDPHMGNYKIQISGDSNDKLVLLDFGAAKKFPEKFLTNYKSMITSSILLEREKFLNAAGNLGFINDTDTPEYIKTFIAFCDETVEPFWNYDDVRNIKKAVESDGKYNWKTSDLPKRIVNSAIKFKNFDLRSPPKDIIFLDRKTGGVFIFLAVLNAHINSRSIINKYLQDKVVKHE